MTERGPVVANYVQTGVAGEWRFEGYACRGWKESGAISNPVTWDLPSQSETP